MKYLIPFVLALTFTACTPPVTVVTPQGVTAYKSDQIVVRVNELMNASIAANAAVPPGLDTNTTRIIVRWCVTADQTLAATPTGWQATLQAGWTATKTTLPPITNPVIAAAMSAVDLVLAGI